MLKWASSMGEVHRKGTDAFQLLRYWGSESGMPDSTGVGAGLMSSAVIAGNTGSMFTPQLSGLTNTIYFQVAVQFNAALTGTPSAGFKIRNGAADQCYIRVEPSPADGAQAAGKYYRLSLYRGATLIASTAYEFYSLEWTVFQIKVTVNTGTSGDIEIRASRRENETFLTLTSVLTVNNINTADTGSAGVDQIGFDYGTNGSVRYDHFWWFDASGSVNNTWPSKVLLVQGVLPNQNGSFNEWPAKGGGGNNYQSLDDSPHSIAEDSGRLTSQVVGERVLVKFPDPDENHPLGSTANVAGVIFQHVSAMENSGVRTVAPLYRNAGGTSAQGTNQLLNSTSFNGFYEIFEDEPVSAAPWTAQQVKDMEWGLILVS